MNDWPDHLKPAFAFCLQQSQLGLTNMGEGGKKSSPIIQRGEQEEPGKKIALVDGKGTSSMAKWRSKNQASPMAVGIQTHTTTRSCSHRSQRIRAVSQVSSPKEVRTNDKGLSPPAEGRYNERDLQVLEVADRDSAKARRRPPKPLLAKTNDEELIGQAKTRNLIPSGKRQKHAGDSGHWRVNEEKR